MADAADVVRFADFVLGAALAGILLRATYVVWRAAVNGREPFMRTPVAGWVCRMLSLACADGSIVTTEYAKLGSDFDAWLGLNSACLVLGLIGVASIQHAYAPTSLDEDGDA